jgi:pimeloyl-ACP methyl ester carboxylesterase
MAWKSRWCWDRPRLGRITAPTLLIGGGPDSQVRQDKLADAASRIPRGQLVTIPAGHYVHNNRPARFTTAVLDWLRGAGRCRRL